MNVMNLQKSSLRCLLSARRMPTRSLVVVRSVDDTPGVQSLLARDRKGPKLQPELADENSFFTPDEKQAAEVTSGESQPATSTDNKQVLKSKRRRREQMTAIADAVVAAGSSAPVQSGPKKCKEAIDQGLELFQQKEYQKAIDMFNLSLELPGNGAYRLASSPREYSCPSDAEENAALYNMACAYAQLGQKASALTCLEAVLENGFEDFKTMKTDGDLQVLGRELQDLVGKYENPVNKAAKGLMGKFTEIVQGKKELVSDTQKKPWIMW